MAENGDGGQMVIVLLLGVVMMMCLSSCCSSLLTAYANECDTCGTFSMFAGNWYWNLVPSTGILGCTAGVTTDASTTVSTTEQVEENKNNQPTTSGGSSDSKCNIGTEANYDYRVREKNSNGEWKCPSGWADTKCGLVSNADGKWVDGDTTGAKQCRKRKSGTTGSNSSSSSSSSDLKVKLVDDPSKGPGSATWDVGVGEYPNLMQDLDRTWNDRIAGFDIPKGLRVIGYTNSNFGGTSITLDGKDEKDAKGYYTHWLDRVNGEQMWDKISSLKVQDMRSSTLPPSSSSIWTAHNSSSGVTLYRDTKYGGKSKQHGTINVSNASDTGMNNVISSMKISPGYVLKGYDDKNFKGKSKTWKSDTDWIGTSWNDKISSYKIYKK